MRALEVISTKVQESTTPGSTVLDLFAGTTVVSQSLADRGFQIIAADAMQYSQYFANALLGIGRLSNSPCKKSLAEIVLDGRNTEGLEELFSSWLEEEKHALEIGDGAHLIQLSKSCPQIWRNANATTDLSRFFCELSFGVGRSGFSTSGIVASHYASTYFGIKQAITIDAIRCSIEAAKQNHILDEWSYNASIAALLSCASKAAFTPGKHFAQYHKVSGDKNLDFHRKRILSDRGVDIEKEFVSILEEIYARPFQTGLSHRALHRSMEQLLVESTELGDVDLIYADPPYTAQQYSRFYHLPEVIACYRIPELQLVSGKPTTGLYSSDRFKSRFSSKRFAPDGFRDLAKLARSKGSDLIVSYSESKSGVTGNSRMISLEALRKVLTETFSSVEVEELKFQYRQFNKERSVVLDKDDRELIIYCRNVK